MLVVILFEAILFVDGIPYFVCMRRFVAGVTLWIRDQISVVRFGKWFIFMNWIK